MSSFQRDDLWLVIGLFAGVVLLGGSLVLFPW